MARIWLRGDYLLNAHLPLCPPHRIITFNIAKMVAYAKSKGVDGYPNMTYDCWWYLATNKLQVCQELAEVYFDLALQVCKAIPTLAIDAETNGDGGKKKNRVPLLGFAVFLYMQQANRLNLRASMSGLEKRPRTYSEREGRGRRSSFSGTLLGQENLEQKVMEFLLTNLQPLLELLSVYDSEIKDYHTPKAKRDALTRNSIVALDLILEGHTMESESVLPFSAVATADRECTHGSIIRIRKLEDFIRKSFQTDPFAIAAPYLDFPFVTADNGVNAAGHSFALKRSSSEARMSTPDLANLKLPEPTDQASPRGGKIVHNTKRAPNSHRMVIVHYVRGQTVGRNDDAMTNSVLHIGKCIQSHIYMMAPLKSVMIRRCRGTTLVLGPTAGTIRLQNCYDCTLVTMCRRLLISDCQRCTIYVKTPTHPIILGSTNSELTFAPYCSTYGDLEKHMASVGLSTRPDKWKEPLVFGNGDLKHVSIDSSILLCWQLMPAKDYYPIVIPFRTSGSTKHIPGGFPSEYKKALEERQTFFDDWNQYTTDLEDEERQVLKELVQKEYATWLEKTGRMEELQQLKLLEAKQRKSQSKSKR